MRSVRDTRVAISYCLCLRLLSPPLRAPATLSTLLRAAPTTSPAAASPQPFSALAPLAAARRCTWPAALATQQLGLTPLLQCDSLPRDRSWSTSPPRQHRMRLDQPQRSPPRCSSSVLTPDLLAPGPPSLISRVLLPAHLALRHTSRCAIPIPTVSPAVHVAASAGTAQANLSLGLPSASTARRQPLLPRE